ncbi:methyltransferase [Pseudonocardia sp. TRM90224]|uniref:methyltransferase n=1 Tax=Pseudonocardia sp. TRM90224 TaxID=2812678 RepID=UPI001E3F5E58|nr:class I SAM-dependent methyltransferase [Pseudonocardia sp. TRM90224]
MQHPTITWNDNGTPRSAPLVTGDAPAGEVVAVDERVRADTALRLATRGTALVWSGEARTARHLLDALKRRLDRRPVREGIDAADTFRRHRQARAHRRRVLGALLVRVTSDVGAACREAFGTDDGLIALQDLLGAVAAYEWRRRGIDVLALGGRIHPHYSVFAPTRQDYVDLVAAAPLPPGASVVDVGTGTGVLAAVLACGGATPVTATDINPRAVACARDNMARHGLDVRVEQSDLFPEGRADVIVCNPPWLPGTPTSPLEAGVFDRGSRMLTTFLRELPAHLSSGGEGWLVISDLAELLGLRSRDWLPETITRAGLHIHERRDAPRRQRTARAHDPLDAYRDAETVSLYRLRVRTRDTAESNVRS